MDIKKYIELEKLFQTALINIKETIPLESTLMDIIHFISKEIKLDYKTRQNKEEKYFFTNFKEIINIEDIYKKNDIPTLFIPIENKNSYKHLFSDKKLTEKIIVETNHENNVFKYDSSMIYIDLPKEQIIETISKFKSVDNNIEHIFLNDLGYYFIIEKTDDYDYSWFIAIGSHYIVVNKEDENDDEIQIGIKYSSIPSKCLNYDYYDLKKIIQLIYKIVHQKILFEKINLLQDFITTITNYKQELIEFQNKPLEFSNWENSTFNELLKNKDIIEQNLEDLETISENDKWKSIFESITYYTNKKRDYQTLINMFNIPNISDLIKKFSF